MGMEVSNSYKNYDNSISTIMGNERENTGQKSLTETLLQEKNSGVVFEKSDNGQVKDPLYSGKKVTKEDREKVIAQLKKADEDRQRQFTDLVKNMLNKQGIAFQKADQWKILAEGDFKADAWTIRKAREEISEDGYWGVKRTSQRLFDFASAYAGEDPEKMKTMQKAMEKGFKLAGGEWGKKLPAICYETMDAARAKFDDWFKEHESEKTTSDK